MRCEESKAWPMPIIGGNAAHPRDSLSAVGEAPFEARSAAARLSRALEKFPPVAAGLKGVQHIEIECEDSQMRFNGFESDLRE
jgi:hypothetical protein